MGQGTGIAWVDNTFNGWWGCQKVSAECDNCYAATFDHRLNGGHWGKDSPRREFGDKHWNDPIRWNKQAIAKGEKIRVFSASMSDWAEDRRDLDKDRARLWELIRQTPALDWLLLTKRANLIEKFLPADWGNGYPNVWLGATVGVEKSLWRIAALKKIPAVVNFLSVEPLIESINIESFFVDNAAEKQWTIVGGESGAHCREMNPNWARSVRDFTREAGAAFFMKQMGGNPDPRHKLSDLPADLRIRDFPRGRELPSGLVLPGPGKRSLPTL